MFLDAGVFFSPFRVSRRCNLGVHVWHRRAPISSHVLMFKVLHLGASLDGAGDGRCAAAVATVHSGFVAGRVPVGVVVGSFRSWWAWVDNGREFGKPGKLMVFLLETVQFQGSESQVHVGDGPLCGQFVDGDKTPSTQERSFSALAPLVL